MVTWKSIRITQIAAQSKHLYAEKQLHPFQLPQKQGKGNKLCGSKYKKKLVFLFYLKSPLQFQELEQFYLHFKQMPPGAWCNLWIALTLETSMTATEFHYSYKVN